MTCNFQVATQGELEITKRPAKNRFLEPISLNTRIFTIERIRLVKVHEQANIRIKVNMLIEQGKIVKVSDGIIFSASVYNDMVDKVKSRIKASEKVSLGEVRDMFSTSRKYAQALLEYLDRQKITRRVGDDRVLY